MATTTPFVSEESADEPPFEHALNAPPNERTAALAPAISKNSLREKTMLLSSDS